MAVMLFYQICHLPNVFQTTSILISSKVSSLKSALQPLSHKTKQRLKHIQGIPSRAAPSEDCNTLIYFIFLYLQDKKGILAQPVKMSLSEEKNKTQAKNKSLGKFVIFSRDRLHQTIADSHNAALKRQCIYRYIWLQT